MRHAACDSTSRSVWLKTTSGGQPVVRPLQRSHWRTLGKWIDGEPPGVHPVVCESLRWLNLQRPADREGTSAAPGEEHTSTGPGCGQT